MKKKIHKIWGVGLTLVIAVSLILWTAPVSAGTLSWSDEDLPDELEPGTDVVDIAVAADGEVIYAAGGFASVGAETGAGTATWDDSDPYSGVSSVKLDHTTTAGQVYLDFPPEVAGMTLGDLEASVDTSDWSFYYYMESGKTTYGPYFDLRFTDPDTPGFTDVSYQMVSVPTTGAWAQWVVDISSTFVFANGYDIDGTTWFQTDGTIALTGIVAAINTEIDPNTCGDWELSSVRINLYDVIEQYCYIDDVTIAGTLYDLEMTELQRSSDSGVGWSSVTVIDGTTVLNAALVAVAPDDENYIAVANRNSVFISDDAGANWDSLGLSGLGTINALALSAAKSGNHFVAVAGDSDVENAIISYYEIGAVGGGWIEISVEADGFTIGTTAGAVAFSPNFASDEVMVAVTANESGGTVDFQIFSFDQKEWNDDAGFGTGYPVGLEQDDPWAGRTFDSASISLSPDFLGSDDSMRLAFVGLTVGGDDPTEIDTSSIQRLEDDDNTVLKEDVHIHSVAYDGSNLVAGRYDDNTVYRCDDPLASSPSVSGTAGLKSPGGVDKVVVAWAGADVVAGTSGDESAFAVSRNNGKTFNDISLIDTDLQALSDVAVSADGSNIYLATANETGGTDQTDLSLWRKASSWERILSVKDTDGYEDFIIRTAPDDMDVVYVADVGGTRIYYSADAGDEKWHTRISTYKIGDLAVETGGDVAYVAEDGTGGYVSKSTNRGFTWATKKSSKLSDGISMLTSLGEDLLLAGSTDGKAAYSTDGNSNWTKLSDGIDGDIVQVAAEGLEEGDLIWAATNLAGDDLYRWDWDDEEWDDEGDTADGYGAYGIALQDGVLYVLTANTTGGNSQLLRSLNPTAADPDFNPVDEADDTYALTPSAMKVSVSGGVIKLWAIDTTADDLVSFKDTIALAGPTLITPKMGFNVPMNPVTGEAMMVTFSWDRPSDDVDGYDLVIAYDDAFDETVKSYTIGDDSSIVSYVADVDWNPNTTYYWRVRVDAATDPDVGDDGTYGPVRSPWSETRSFRVEALEVTPAVEVAPVPEITVTIPPAPSITLPAPEIIIPTPEIVLPAPQVTLPPSPAPVAPIPGWALYAIIFIGAVLVIALIVLILRTRRPV